MRQLFSDSSDVSVVLTSCGRLDLLKTTVASFLQFNTYPIKQFILIEDSGNQACIDSVPEDVRENFDFIINAERKGQIASIDLAYSRVDTPYIFHCEDDWEFYRAGFIEDSKTVLESAPEILQVWLRSYYHDIKVHSPYHYLSDHRVVDGVRFDRVGSEKPDWQGFSFNPGLRRKADYEDIGSYGSFHSEKQISLHYANQGKWAAILENDAVAHIGFGSHVEDPREKKKQKRKKGRQYQKQAIFLLIAIAFGFWLGGQF